MNTDTPLGTATLAVIVVQYNRQLRDLPAFKCARAESGANYQWIFVDNSDEPVGSMDNDLILALDNVSYAWMGGNRGISAAFNQGVTLASSKVTHVCFLDQDTTQIESYLSAATARFEENVDIYVPTVLAGEEVLSPSRRFGPVFRPARDLSKLPHNFSCINSGMIVRREFFDTVKFDESLFLDFVDHKFISDARSAGASFALLSDFRLTQSYSRKTDDLKSAVSRFAIFQRDARTFHNSRFLPAIIIGWRAVKATLRYRSVCFFRELMKSENVGS